jgi:hypothetical protein
MENGWLAGAIAGKPAPTGLMCIGWKMVGWQVAHREQAHSYMIDVHLMENGWLAGAIASRLTPT